jgi:hypothetical protein
MDQTQQLKPMEEEKEPIGEVEETEEMKPMPFGFLGISFLCHLTQYAVYLGLTMILLMIIRIFGPK